MPTNVHHVIAQALYRVLLQHAQKLDQAEDRSFFRLDGFSPEVYVRLLDQFQSVGMRLGPLPLTVRTAGSLGADYAGFTLESGRTPTYYRNHVPEGHALVLIFNEITPDAQSLASLYGINETLLAGPHLGTLIQAVFSNPALDKDDLDLLTTFLRRFTKEVREPQLRSVAEFLMLVRTEHELLRTMASAISMALPALGLFAAETLTNLLAQGKRTEQIRLLRAIDRAAFVNLRPVDSGEQERCLERVEKLALMDDGPGRSPEEKRAWLEAFVRGQDARSALTIDWNEVEGLVTGQRSEKKQPPVIRKEIGQQLLAGVIAKQGLEVLGNDERSILKELEGGLDPGKERIKGFLDAMEPYLPPRVVTKVEKQWGLQGAFVTSDFPLGLTTTIMKLLRSFERLSEDATVTVKFDGDRADLNREAAAFVCLYGGIESYMQSIAWQLGELGAGGGSLTPLAVWEETDSERQVEGDFAPIPFIVTIKNGADERSGRLEWTLARHSAGWDLVHAITALRQTSEESGVVIPLFKAPREERSPNISALSSTIGPWWREPDSLGVMWAKRAAEFRGIDPDEAMAVSNAIERFEAAFGEFLLTAEQGVLLGIDELLPAYQMVQETAAAISAQTGISLVQDLLNRAFIITVPDRSWVAVPLLHPLKLLWHKGRCRQLDAVIYKLLEPRAETPTTNLAFLQRELEQKYSSAYFPAVLTLGTLSSGRSAFLPDAEDEGAELYRPIDAGMDHMDSTGNSAAVRAAVEQAAATVAETFRDYLESYPFAKAGMRVLLANVHSPVLPQALLNRLHTMPVMEGVRLELIVHTPAQGARLYNALHRWVLDKDELQRPQTDSYFPSVLLTVEEGEIDRVLSRPQSWNGGKLDLVVLVDAISEGKQKVVSVELAKPVDVSPDNFDPYYQPEAQIFERGQAVRRVLITPDEAPAVLRHYYRSQHLCLDPTRNIPMDGGVRFVRELELGAWANLLETLHQRAVWVICYDMATDRFLLESTTRNDQVHIIRHRSGLGLKRLHNLTVSAAATNRKQVIRRLTQRLAGLLGDTEEHGKRFAQDLVERAQSLSGFVVLGATGPGTKLNELLGLVMTQWRVEQRVRQEWPDALITWIFLDDHPDWFPSHSKRPDMLCVAARLEGDTVHLWLVVAESKFVSRGLIDSEYKDGATQVAIGLKSLAPGLAPNHPAVECGSWYSQLQAALTDNLVVNDRRVEWDKVREAIARGQYLLRMQGQVWVFGYDDWSDMSDVREEDLESTADCKRIGFRANRRAVRETLLGMLNEKEKSPLVLPTDPAGDDEGELSPDAPDLDANAHKEATMSAGVTPDHTALPESEQTEKSSGLLHGEPTILERTSVPAVGEGLEISGDAEVPTRSDETSAVQDNTVWTQVQQPVVDAEGTSDIAKSDSSPSTVRGSAPAGQLVQLVADRPVLALLNDYDARAGEAAAEEYAQESLRRTIKFFQTFGLDVRAVDYQVGPRVIRLRVDLRISKASRFDKMEKERENLKLFLKLKVSPQIRSGDDGYVWIDIPRLSPALIGLKRLLEIMPTAKRLPETRFPLGVQLNNEPFYADLRKVPHWLVGGTSGSGKSVLIRSILLSLMLTNSPETLRLVIIDPKGDLSAFRSSPFTEEYVSGRTGLARAAAEALQRIKQKMDTRLELMNSKHEVNEIDDYNRLEGRPALSRYVVLVEEFGDLISDKEHRDAIQLAAGQIAAVGRAPGFHLFICTQNPVAETVTTDIKANCSGRIALFVKSHVNSQVILGEPGAENLLKNGDLLYAADEPPIRLQAPLVDLLDEIRPVLARLANEYQTTERGEA